MDGIAGARYWGWEGAVGGYGASTSEAIAGGNLPAKPFRLEKSTCYVKGSGL